MVVAGFRLHLCRSCFLQPLLGSAVQGGGLMVVAGFHGAVTVAGHHVAAIVTGCFPATKALAATALFWSPGTGAVTAVRVATRDRCHRSGLMLLSLPLLCCYCPTLEFIVVAGLGTNGAVGVFGKAVLCTGYDTTTVTLLILLFLQL
ncbi:hypothetical protein PIB30_088916 [Stylosanthes scabra]|uniref:Uncharacterized protein n=1 Tax=Stylosanthes scabra TaxID=79078 RepID=A0ABU6ZSJ5_9FABA|nr:hypothetical protein [Stylosanthes scabra]